MAGLVTQKDIARKLAISQSHVAGVLAGNPRTGASANTRRLILETAQSLGYVPQATGQMLQRGKTNSVSMPYTSPFHAPDSRQYSAAIQTIAEAIGLAGYKLDVKAYRDHEAIVNWLPTMAKSRCCDAVVLWGADEDVEEEACLTESLGHPFIARGRYEATHPNWIQIDYDHEGMMRLAVDKAVDIGRGRIAYLGHENRFPYAKHLREGFLTAVKYRIGQVTPPEWILINDETDAGRVDVAKRISAWMDMPESERPTAIVCGAGQTCMSGVEMMMLERGLRFGDAPGQLSWVGGEQSERSIVGQSWRFGGDHQTQIVRTMIELQLLPLLQEGAPRQRILRYLPPIVPSSAPTFSGRIDLLVPFRDRSQTL